MYKKTNTNYIIRISDNVCIPDDIKNKDYQEYLNWVSKGNTPLPIDPKTPEEIALEDFFNKTKIERNKLNINSVVKYLREHTTEEIDTYIQTNITNLVDVKNILSKLATAIGVLLRD